MYDTNCPMPPCISGPALGPSSGGGMAGGTVDTVSSIPGVPGKGTVEAKPRIADAAEEEGVSGATQDPGSEGEDEG